MGQFQDLVKSLIHKLVYDLLRIVVLLAGPAVIATGAYIFHKWLPSHDFLLAVIIFIMATGIFIAGNFRNVMVLDKFSDKTTSLRKRALKTADQLERLQVELGPEPEVKYDSSMDGRAYTAANVKLGEREQKMFHAVQGRFSSTLFQLYHDFGEQRIQNEDLINAVRGRVETDKQLSKIITGLREMAHDLTRPSRNE